MRLSRNAHQAVNLATRCQLLFPQDTPRTLAAMYGRVKKHLGTSNLCFRAWERLAIALSQRYASLGKQLAACYPGLALKPSPAELKDQLRTIG